MITSWCYTHICFTVDSFLSDSETDIEFTM
ncbi:rCG38083 [Rattus norvegicus]|uniref:RCG38083 n=1 Tax=Rattus norvegicus TaxID=10116 RepID=A6IVD5_RAT|nr:rCG38083 [Rattus norvegicus]